MSTIKINIANKSPATSCPVNGYALARLELLRAFLMPVEKVISGLCF
ncbi:hypothetical protein [Mucilaginibacter defluvii]